MTVRSVLGSSVVNDNDRSERIAASNHKRTLRLRALVLASSTADIDPMLELLAAARAGDTHAQWRADQLYVNWRPGHRKAVESCE